MKKIGKAVLVGLGIICVVIGLAGIFIPVLPTTPLLLLAAFLFARSSDRALEWLLTNRWFGPYIRNYREGRGMSARDKAITLFSLWLTIGLTSTYIVESGWVRVVVLAIAGGVTIHLLRIKTHRPDRGALVFENSPDV